jgi:Arc/MetJ-type ribon-helix-helix transcriptional regulator
VLLLLQEAIRQAIRATAAAEAERNAMRQQLQDAGAQQQAAEALHAAAKQQEQHQQENGESPHTHVQVHFCMQFRPSRSINAGAARF